MKKLPTWIKNGTLRLLASKNPVARNVVKLKRAFRLKIFETKEKKILEICGGRNPLSTDHINVDILDYPSVDVVADLHGSLPFITGTIDQIVSIATLEHFNVSDVKKVLREFHRVLKRGGVLEIGIPSLKKIFLYYEEHGCDDTVLRYLHGGLKDNYDIHLCVTDYTRFKKILEDGEFTDVEEQEYDYPFHNNAMMMKVRAKKSQTDYRS